MALYWYPSNIWTFCFCTGLYFTEKLTVRFFKIFHSLIKKKLPNLCLKGELPSKIGFMLKMHHVCCTTNVSNKSAWFGVEVKYISVIFLCIVISQNGSLLFNKRYFKRQKKYWMWYLCDRPINHVFHCSLNVCCEVSLNFHFQNSFAMVLIQHLSFCPLIALYPAQKEYMWLWVRWRLCSPR